MDGRTALPLRAFWALWLLVGMGTAGLGGCTTLTQEEEKYVERPAEELYDRAMALLAGKEFVKAAKAFEEVERQHPYSRLAVKSEIMAAYAYYQAADYDAAVAAAERFIDLHPGHRDVPYAQYLIGISYYEQISDVGRDQGMTQKALDALTTLVRRFPESEYARDARLKIDLVHDHLAGKEMEVGRFYQRRGEYVAAVNRFRTVVEKYQTTTHVPEALHRLVECYLALGLEEEARRTAAVLGYNFPNDKWYARSYALLQGKPLPEGERSWLSSLWPF